MVTLSATPDRQGRDKPVQEAQVKQGNKNICNLPNCMLATNDGMHLMI